MGGTSCAISVTNSRLLATRGAWHSTSDASAKAELEKEINALKSVVHLLVSASYPPAKETGPLPMHQRDATSYKALKAAHKWLQADLPDSSLHPGFMDILDVYPVVPLAYSKQSPEDETLQWRKGWGYAQTSPQEVPVLTVTPTPLNPTPDTLRPAPYTLHPTPYTLHPTP